MPISSPLRTAPTDVLASVVSGRHGIGTELNAIAIAAGVSAAWPTANKAFYMPFYMPRSGTVTKLWWVNGATASGNLDIGLYRADYTKIISAGSTAQGTISVVQEVDITDTFLAGSTLYYIGLSCDNGTATVQRLVPGSVFGELSGVMQQTSAFPLPSPAVPAVLSVSYIPICGVAFRTLVA